MDLWHMFSTDFVEGDSSLNDQLQTVDDGLLVEPLPPPPNIDMKDAMNNEPSDDTIFNFDLEPIANISNDNNRHSQRTKPGAMPHHSNTYNNIMQRPTATQINATDENGMPINYEIAVVYICPACGDEFHAQDTWKAHMNYLHQFNTRRGLNFERVDKLYHQCLECNKNIAMHSMENLLKHKFTHLPFRCVKCAVCLRQYKYRQDLMVHLRMLHKNEVISLMRDPSNSRDGPIGSGTRYSTKQKPSLPPPPQSRLSIANIKENAVDIFGGRTDENIEVKNELIEPDDINDNEQAADMLSSSAFNLPAFLDDTQSRSSPHFSGDRADNGHAYRSKGNNKKDDAFEDYIHYICPQCGTECETRGQWSQHIEFVHDFASAKGLNFKDQHQQAQCLECEKILEPYSIEQLQQHKFSHLPNGEWMRCKLCYLGFSERKMIHQHLQQAHRLTDSADALVGNDDESQEYKFGNDGDDFGADFDGMNDDSMLLEPMTRNKTANTEERGDLFEPHIDYICPQCGREFYEKKLWRTHMMKTHQLNDMKRLNFRVVNERQLACNECDKVITNAYGIQNAQQHRITHMPYKAFARCRICDKSYTDRKGLVKHIRTRHRSRIGLSNNNSAYPQTTAALQRSPISQPTPKRSKIENVKYEQQKQIVTIANVTYEINYLDDEPSQPNDFRSLDYDDSTILGDEDYIMNNRQHQQARYKCVDCASIFTSQTALQAHIKDEHEFLDFSNETTLPSNKHSTTTPTPRNPLEEDSNSCSNSGTIATSTANTTSIIESNFIYMCPSCGEEFKTQFTWRRHINESHGFDKRSSLNFRQLDRYRYQCIQCKDIVAHSKLKGLQDHHFRHLPYKLYIKCLICGTTYNHKPNMLSHLRVRHNIYDETATTDNDYPQPTFKQLTTQQRHDLSTQHQQLLQQRQKIKRPAALNTLEDSISFHNAVDLDFITYFCPQCNVNFSTHAFWRKHIVEAHNFNTRDGLNFRQIDNHHFLCLECYKRVTVTHTKGAIGQLQSHKFRHLPYRSFKCLSCNVEFVRKQMFFKHLNRATNRCDNEQVGIDLPAAAEETSTTPSATKKQPQQQRQNLPIKLASGTKAAERGNYDDDNDDTVLGGDGDNDTAATSGVCNALILNQSTFKILCPQCGKEFDNQRPWREHINNEHGLGKRENLNVTRLSHNMHQCHECGEQIGGAKLRNLQTHKFKHLPFGAYIRCNLCTQSYYHIHNMQEHLRHKHPNVVQKHDEYAKMAELQKEDEAEEDEVILNDDNDNDNDEIDNDDDDDNDDDTAIDNDVDNDDDVDDDDNDNDEGDANEDDEDGEEDDALDECSSQSANGLVLPAAQPNLINFEDLDEEEQYLLG